MKKFKNLKLVVLLVLFIVLIVPLVYLVSPIRSVADQKLLEITPLEILNNENSLVSIPVLIIIAIFLAWVIFELTNMTEEVNLLFSSISFCLESILGIYLISSTRDGFFLSTLSFVGVMITFFMSLLLMRTCLIWQSRRAVKKNWMRVPLFSFFLIK